MPNFTWCKSLISQASALEKLAATKVKCGKDMRGSINAVSGLQADSIEYSCFGRARTKEVRRKNILSSLNYNYKHSSSETAPGYGMLFGSDFEGAMKNVETTNPLSRNLLVTIKAINKVTVVLFQDRAAEVGLEQIWTVSIQPEVPRTRGLRPFWTAGISELPVSELSTRECS